MLVAARERGTGLDSYINLSGANALPQKGLEKVCLSA
jgi:hypothetical protein